MAGIGEQAVLGRAITCVPQGIVVCSVESSSGEKRSDDGAALFPPHSRQFPIDSLAVRRDSLLSDRYNASMISGVPILAWDPVDFRVLSAGMAGHLPVPRRSLLTTSLGYNAAMAREQEKVQSG